MVRKERLELSHPKILEPKSSASTNSATSAHYFGMYKCIRWEPKSSVHFKTSGQFRHFRTLFWYL